MGRDLSVNNNGNGAITLSEQMQWAKLAESADIVPDSYRGKPANILVAVGFGASMGLSPAESLYRIAVIKGKPTMGAELIASQVRRAGHHILPKQEDMKRQSVTVTIIRADMPDYKFTVTRDMEWAHSMGLDQPSRNGQPSNYQRQPMTMLYWRALSACAREACPEALYGAGYTPDELEDVTMPDEVAEQPSASVNVVDGRIVATDAQRERFAGMLREWGVDSLAKASAALSALAGAPQSGRLADFPDDVLLLALDDEAEARSRVLKAITPAIEPQEESK